MNHKKIAQAANVSLSTVSKALSGSREVSEEISQKIINIAIELGYFEEKSKRRIEYTKNKSITVAIVCPEIVSIHYAIDMTAIKKEIEAQGGIAAIYVYDFDYDKMNKIVETIMLRNYADGIILFAEEMPKIKPSIPVVCISDSVDEKYDNVSCDIDLCFCEIIKHLKDRGHTKIGFVGELETKAKLAAYKKAMKDLELTVDENNVYIINERFERIGYKAVEEMMKKKNLPTAVVCAYDEIELALIHGLTENGIDVPERISVVGINDIPIAEYSQIPLTTVRFFYEELSTIVTKLLYGKIFENAAEVQRLKIGHKLIERQSTGMVYTEKSSKIERRTE